MRQSKHQQLNKNETPPSRDRLLYMIPSDPLGGSAGSFTLPMTDNAIVEAFDAAAMSFAMNHGLPKPATSRIEDPPRLSIRDQLPEPAIPVLEDIRAPKPNPGLVYPPPLPLDRDPDRIRLLHAWYWAGYYTGLSDGRNAN